MTTPITNMSLMQLQQRVQELEAVQRVLWPDRDDPRVLSELTIVATQLGNTRRELNALKRGAA